MEIDTTHKHIWFTHTSHKIQQYSSETADLNKYTLRIAYINAYSKNHAYLHKYTPDLHTHTQATRDTVTCMSKHIHSTVVCAHSQSP